MIREITKQQIEQKSAQGERVVLIEALEGSEQDYDAKHIPYSMPMPINRVRELASQYLPDSAAEIVVYGRDASSTETDSVAHLLSGMGYVNLYVYRGGKQEWFGSSGYRESIHDPLSQSSSASNSKSKRLRMVREFASSTMTEKWPPVLMIRAAGRALSSRRLAPVFRGVVWGLAIYGGVQIIRSLALRRKERLRGTDEASELSTSPRHRIVDIDESSEYEGSASSFHSASGAE